MKKIRNSVAALIALGFAASPFAASAQTSAVGTPNNTSGSSGAPATQGSATYGSSGQTVGTVTAPSIGSYNRPSVGVTNSVPTWNNTNPQAR
ncbi:hypothetical protein [Bradyrhizobium ganzhouense]|uniref:hypothetical protein n=1 Tax=Bradyrhizobium ganzhouense TaxID=1179767 RepID=UPI003CF4622D